MGFNIDQFICARPYLFHLTAQQNLPHIRKSKVLFPAAQLLAQSGNSQHIAKKRQSSLIVEVAREPILIRDQHPLHSGNIKLLDNLTFEDFVSFLNEHVFFWPGTDSGPISYGLRHFARYQHENPIIIRVTTRTLIGNNPKIAPYFCKYNSGAPRCVHGKGSPRGNRTFVPAAEAEFTPSNVVEVTFNAPVAFPRVVETAPSPSGPWKRL